MKYYFFHALHYGGNSSGVWAFEDTLNPVEVIEKIKSKISTTANVSRASIEFTQFHKVD